jgi:hypothetical protein
MRTRHLHRLVKAILVVAILAGAVSGPAAIAQARRSAPTLCTGGIGGKFAVRPTAVYTAAGAMVYQVLGPMLDKGGAIRWSSWTGTDARGKGTLWTRATETGYRGRPASIAVTRVRGGHFTRMTIRYRGGPQGWDPGSHLYVDQYHLMHWSSGQEVLFSWQPQ